MIYTYYATDQQAGAVHALEDLLAVTFHGDQKLETFLNNWDSVLVGMDLLPDMSTLYTLFHRQIKDSKVKKQIELRVKEVSKVKIAVPPKVGVDHCVCGRIVLRTQDK